MSETSCPPPAWFSHAIARPAESRFVSTSGCAIHYRFWQGANPGARPLLFVHGNIAHARWWDFIAPFFLPHWQPVALDLGGMGDSASRPVYAPADFASDVLAVAEAITDGLPPLVVAHSFGGYMSTLAASLRPERFAGLVVVDSPLRDAEARARRPRRRRLRFKRHFAEREAGVAKFRLHPEQPITHPFLVDYIAWHSLVREKEGWTWKFDVSPFEDSAFDEAFWDDLNRRYGALSLPVSYIGGALSAYMEASIIDHIEGLRAGRTRIISIPQAHHHIMLDQPLALIAALRAQFEAWRSAGLLAADGPNENRGATL